MYLGIYNLEICLRCEGRLEEHQSIEPVGYSCGKTPTGHYVFVFDACLVSW